jgi:hypothetical protein
MSQRNIDMNQVTNNEMKAVDGAWFPTSHQLIKAGCMLMGAAICPPYGAVVGYFVAEYIHDTYNC